MGCRTTGLIALALVLAAAGARAEDGNAVARRRYDEGQRLYVGGRLDDALAAFQAAQAALPRAEFDYNIGLCLEGLRRDREAADAFERFLRARPLDADAANLRAKIVGLRAAGPPATTAAPAPAVTSPPSRPSSAPARWVATRRGIASVALLSSGAAMLVSAVVTGGVALSDRDAYDGGCASRGCDPSQYDQAHRLAIATDVLIGVGVAAAATGLVLFLTRPRTHERALYSATVGWMSWP